MVFSPCFEEDRETGVGTQMLTQQTVLRSGELETPNHYFDWRFVHWRLAVLQPKIDVNLQRLLRYVLGLTGREVPFCYLTLIIVPMSIEALEENAVRLPCESVSCIRPVEGEVERLL